jgi:NitT/TauT family transport system ATP-binding protein
MGGLSLAFENVGISFMDARGRPRPALEGINLQIKANEFVSFLGPSGCGKTTLLRIAAGLIEPTTGTVKANGARVQDGNVQAGYVPQTHALFPWLTVRQNAAYGLRFKGADGIEYSKLDEILKEVGLLAFADYYPKALSGGMAQRASLARALVIEPNFLLMDEPLGSLDSLTRSNMQEHILETWSAHTNTVLFVTHDIEEAVYVADRVVLMSGAPGKIRHIFEVPLPRPRTPSMKRSGEFGTLVDRILEEFAV